MGYTSKAVKGLFWTWGLTFSSRIISLIRTIILARILSPSQFGVYGIGILSMALMETLTETGINVFLVQKKDKIDDYINSAWFVSILRGFIIFSFILIISPMVAAFFNSNDSIWILIVFGISALIKGFINPSYIKFQKDLNFDKEFQYRIAITIVEAVVSITLAFYTHLAISLALGFLAGSIIEVILSFALIHPWPKYNTNFFLVKEIISKGKWITLSGVFSYFFHNFDNIVVGRLLGVGSLGLYEMAYNISMLPITDLSDVVSKVTFPVYSLISSDNKRLKKAFLKSLFFVSAVSIPFGLIIFIFPTEIISIVLGEKWLKISNVLRVLVIFGVIRSISGLSSALFLSVEKQKYVTVVTLFSIIGLSLTIIPLVVKFGIIGAGISALIGSLLSLPFMIYFSVKILFSKK